MTRSAVLIGVLLALAVPAATASAAPQQVIFTMTRDLNPGSDTWSAAGAIVDGGTFADDPAFFGGRSLTLHVDRTLVGTEGTLTLRGDVRLIPTDDPDVIAVTGRWNTLSGTERYATTYGSGPISETFNVAEGTVNGVWSGSLVTAP
jgi:hypothetical protein